MNTQNTWDSVKKFFEKIGRRNMMIAGAVVLVVGAVAVNWIFFSSNDAGDGYNYEASAGMSTNYGTTLTTTEVGDDNSTPTGGEADSTDKYFSSVEMSRQRARDEALEVLNAVVENDKATDAVKEPPIIGYGSISSCTKTPSTTKKLCPPIAPVVILTSLPGS